MKKFLTFILLLNLALPCFSEELKTIKLFKYANDTCVHYVSSKYKTTDFFTCNERFFANSLSYTGDWYEVDTFDVINFYVGFSAKAPQRSLYSDEIVLYAKTLSFAYPQIFRTMSEQLIKYNQNTYLTEKQINILKYGKSE